MLHEVALRTQKSKDPVTVINHHGLIKLIVSKALSQTQLTWDNLIGANKPLQLEQPELCHENPLQETEEIQGEEATAQIEVSPPQPEVEADPVQMTEVQTSWTEAQTSQTKAQTPQAGPLTRKRKREMDAPKTPIERTRRNR
jgi:hypothetical protein